MIPLPSSPAINAATTSTVAEDQRGRLITDNSPDIGATEFFTNDLNTFLNEFGEDEFIETLSQRTLAAMDATISEEDRWQGFELKAIDGCSVKLMDTPENQEQYPQPYPQPSVQKKAVVFQSCRFRHCSI